MRNSPEDAWDHKAAERLNAAPWQMELLKFNPEYAHWGPGDDYMKGFDGNDWNSAQKSATWANFDKSLNELNECVNFHFAVERASEKCSACKGSGIHPDAQWVADSFYQHKSPFIYNPEEDARTAAITARFGLHLSDSCHARGSYPDAATLKRYNAHFKAFCQEMQNGCGYWGKNTTEEDHAILRQEHRRTPGDPHFLSHDAINIGVMSRARCEKYGIPYECPKCEGHGYTYTAPAAHVELTLWRIHPRKGASRGVLIERVDQADLPAIFTWLREAAKRNAERFERLPK